MARRGPWDRGALVEVTDEDDETAGEPKKGDGADDGDAQQRASSRAPQPGAESASLFGVALRLFIVSGQTVSHTPFYASRIVWLPGDQPRATSRRILGERAPGAVVPGARF